MRWTSVAWVSCLLPVLAGCNTARHAVQYVTQSVTTDNGPLHARAEDGPRRAAQAAWETVRGRHTGRAFSDEFRDGFVDGFADFLAHGAASQAPAVPPVPYERYKNYLGPAGHALVRDYYLGFQYGGEVAGATGRQSGEPATRPAAKPSAAPAPSDTLPPRPLPETGKFGEPRKRSDDPPLLLPPGRDGKGRAIPPLPKPGVPVVKPFNPDLTGAKLAPIPVPSDPERLPVPNPPLPVSEPIEVPLVVPSAASERTLSVLDNIPVIPLRYPIPK